MGRKIKNQDQNNEIETKRTIQRINEIFEKINKTDKPLANLIRNRKKNTQINKIRKEEGDITINTNEIQRIIRQ
jgi:hypothetical protein